MVLLNLCSILSLFPLVSEFYNNPHVGIHQNVVWLSSLLSPWLHISSLINNQGLKEGCICKLYSTDTRVKPYDWNITRRCILKEAKLYRKQQLIFLFISYHDVYLYKNLWRHFWSIDGIDHPNRRCVKHFFLQKSAKFSWLYLLLRVTFDRLEFSLVFSLLIYRCRM